MSVKVVATRLPCIGWYTLIMEFRAMRLILKDSKRLQRQLPTVEHYEDSDRHLKRLYRQHRDAFRRHLCN
jgi:hypothetical protein